MVRFKFKARECVRSLLADVKTTEYKVNQCGDGSWQEAECNPVSCAESIPPVCQQGTCSLDLTNGEFDCQCPPGYFGDRCEKVSCGPCDQLLTVSALVQVQTSSRAVQCGCGFHDIICCAW